MKGERGSTRAHPAEASLHLVLENTTSETISWEAMTEGGLSVNGCDMCPRLTLPLPLLPFFHQLKAPIYAPTSLYHIILTP